MFAIDEKASILGVSELRTKTNYLLEELKKNRVILTKRNEPLAVVLSLREYHQLKEMAEETEDSLLGQVVLKRIKNKPKNYIPHSTVKKIAGL